MRPGSVFSITDQSGTGITGDYLVTAARHAAFTRVTNGVQRVYYGCQFEVVPAALAWHAALQTPKPIARMCTAEVTGPTPQQPFVDKFGRVEVRFHWDRYGAKDGTSSAWLRVASPVAGATHGMIFAPRVGDEVLVDFLQGDPDQPVVLGSLFNADAPVPYQLPAEASRATIRSSSAAGSVNEIRFDDTTGREEMMIQARTLNIETPQSGMRFDDSNGQLQIKAPTIDFKTSSLLVNGSDLRNTNTVMAWARVAADGSIARASYGISDVTNSRPGMYSVTLERGAAAASTLVPVAVAERNGQPTTPAAMRLVSVEAVAANSFNVYVMSGLGTPTNSAFTVIVTGH